MSEIVRRSGLIPLKSSTNIINSKKLLAETQKNLNDLKNEKYLPKVSSTEQNKFNMPKKKSKTNSSSKLISKSKKTNDKEIISTSNSHSIKNCQNLKRRETETTTKEIFNKEQRIKHWLISKEKIQDSEYWNLTSKRLSKELIELLDQIDDLELENELLIAEFEQMSKLSEKACKLKKILKSLIDF